MEELCKRGVINSIVFHNDENGYTIARVEGNGERFTAVGSLPGAQAGMSFEFFGHWTTHPNYGEQFAFMEYREVIPEKKDDIEIFLASGAIRGVGPKTAKAIVDQFGDETLKVMENDPGQLLRVEGIGRKKQKIISASFAEHREFAAVVLDFQQYGIAPASAMRLYREYGSAAVDAVKENPYRIIDDVFGIGFKTADAIAMKMGIEANSAYRIQASIAYILRRCTLDGHTFLPKQELIEKAVALLDVTGDEIEDGIFALTLAGDVNTAVLEGMDTVFLSVFYLAERSVCVDLIRLGTADLKTITADTDGLIRATETASGVELSDKQKEAVKESLYSGVFVITGGPGTGKTTIINAIMDIFAHCGFRTVIAAPTGRAAKRITETSGHPASTIHRLLEYTYSEDDEDMSFGRNAENRLECDAVIIDEASMIDVLLMKALAEAIPDGARLIIVGDADQLPPVGAGNVLRDMLDSEKLPFAHLTEIFRQARESMIVVNAHRIDKGEYPSFNGEDTDFYMLRRSGDQNIMRTVVNLCVNRLPAHFEHFDVLRDIQVLTPVKKGILGNINLNKELQRAINPPSNTRSEKIFGERIFREGDKVMQIRNNYMLKWVNDGDFSEGEGVFNGDMGYIEYIDDDLGTVSVVYDDTKHVVYETDRLDELEHAYAVTVHKSQGSEFPAVVIPVFGVAPTLATRNLIYTAITRGKKLVVLVGSEERLRGMIDNDRRKERHSALKFLLRDGYGVF
ncbi:MAG: ATP-dependent RecD-like DNA helicase [Clostridiales Family XIII bacterium]|jgi:exodeoxyribonuclease V alpha subunit|nr:ATP-dependent RecD-like DNA helicase [Clostridiales Family XIII bacterium]